MQSFVTALMAFAMLGLALMFIPVLAFFFGYMGGFLLDLVVGAKVMLTLAAFGVDTSIVNLPTICGSISALVMFGKSGVQGNLKA